VLFLAQEAVEETTRTHHVLFLVREAVEMMTMIGELLSSNDPR
jgi:hypothetical protein